MSPDTVSYTTLSDADLRAAYWQVRRSLAGVNALAHPSLQRRNRAVVAGQVFRLLEEMDLIVAAAERRHVDLFEERA